MKNRPCRLSSRCRVAKTKETEVMRFVIKVGFSFHCTISLIQLFNFLLLFGSTARFYSFFIKLKQPALWQLYACHRKPRRRRSISYVYISHEIISVYLLGFLLAQIYNFISEEMVFAFVILRLIKVVNVHFGYENIGIVAVLLPCALC